MIIALQTDPSEDLRPLIAWLNARGVPHRVFEASGRLQIAVPDEALVPVVLEGHRHLASGDLEMIPAPAAGRARWAVVQSTLARFPVTTALVSLAVLFFPATYLGGSEVPTFTLRWLMIVPIERIGDFIHFTTLADALKAGQIWRLWTPVLLHFGILHLVFNLLWMWEFGRRIEIAGGGRALVEAVLILAPVSNLAQYLMMDGPQFGGLSGVVYGLLGYLVVAGRRSNHPAYRVPAALVVVMILFLVFFTTGATEPFGLHVANAAHWGGFLMGLVWGFLRLPRAAGSGVRGD